MGQAGDAADRALPPGRLLTVGIPVYNGRALLRNCLRSVLDSTLPRSAYEIVVVDDGSSEPETRQILHEFQDGLATDPGFLRVIWSEVNSGGAARPRNRILDEATGTYVFFVDSDDTIGTEALARIAAALATTPADWVAVNQVPVNGRAAVCVVRPSHAEVPRARALSTLTVHKVFRRAEVERQGLRFDEGLPSGQDVAFAFSYLVNANRFLMLGGYDYYYLTQHTGNLGEPRHLSRRARTPKALVEKNERILRAMLTALQTSRLPETERREIVGRIVLPRVLIRQRYLRAIVNAGPETGTRALWRLAELLADPLVTGLDPGQLKDLTADHLALIAEADWTGLADLVTAPSGPQRLPAGPSPRSRFGVAVRWVARGRRSLDVLSGRARHRRVMRELGLLRQSVADVREAQRRLAAELRPQPSEPRA